MTELGIGFDPDLHRTHRRRLLDALGPGEVAVLVGATEAVRNDDVHHPFRQDSDLWWATGFEEPDAIAILDPASETPFVLFVHPRDREMEVWNGLRAGVEGAVETYGADAAFPLGELDRRLPELLLERDVVRYPLGSRIAPSVHRALDRLRALAGRYGDRVPSVEADLRPIMGELRLRKDETEQAHLARAGAVSAEGHRAAMAAARPGLTEFDVQRVLEGRFRELGSVRDGYPSIVASGPNACILHYTENRRVLGEGDLLLIDAGAEWWYQSADITRTFPVSGRFTPPQRAVYEAVLAAQRAAFALCRPGSDLDAVHDAAARSIAEALVELGLLPGPVERVLTMNHHREFFMHGTSHWLGLDVHDAGAYAVDGRPRPLEPGMVFTVEPGIYISADRPTVRLALLEYDEKAWRRRRIMLGRDEARKLEEQEREAAGWIEHEIPPEMLGIGVRIEDDLLITAEGFVNLTDGVPTDPDEVEALAGG